MDTQQFSTLLLLCGDVQYPLEDFTPIVTWCPIRRELLKRSGVVTELFGDFGPSRDQGRELDVQLFTAVDRALQREAETNPALDFAPLGIQQVVWRLSRYRWLRACMTAIVEHYTPAVIVLSSDRDADMALALKTVARGRGIDYRIEQNPLDPPTNIMHRLAPYGIPNGIDPLWLTRIVAFLLKRFHPNAQVLYEPYWNISDGFKGPDALAFPLVRYTSVLRTAVRKLFKQPWQDDGQPDPPICEADSALISAEVWSAFSEDDRVMVNSVLIHFLQRLPPRKVLRVRQALSALFATLKPRRLILASDLVSSGRLLASVAHEHGIAVDFLPHGIVWEDRSGARQPSDFVPDRMLAWTKTSQQAYEKLGWSATAIAHPVNRSARQPLRPLRAPWQALRAVLLLPEWLYVSHAGREDIMIAGCIKIYEGLSSLGVLPSNIWVKSHRTSFSRTDAIRRKPLERLQNELGYGFSLLESATPTIRLMPQFDLAVMGVTTGIYEAALTGTPLVLFGYSPQRVGALDGISLPSSMNAAELAHVVRTYDNAAVEHMYAEIVRRLHAGRPLSDV